LNIFAVSSCPIESAQQLCSIHVNKMLQETVQLLSTAHHVLDGTSKGTKPTHQNHPSAIWVRESSQNYRWAVQHAFALLDVYTTTTGKEHGYTKYLLQVGDLPDNIQDMGITDFRMAMPDEFKIAAFFDPHKAYQLYLKSKYHDWQHRTDKRRMRVVFPKGTPHWMLD